MWYTIVSYFKFLITSTNQHGVHSPFVYKLITECFYDKTKYPDYLKLKHYRQSLLKNKSRLEITDLGSGSKRKTTNKRAIRNIAINSGTTFKRAKLLFRFSNYIKPTKILELGTSLGIATQAMHLGNPESQIMSIEGCPNSSFFAKERLKEYQNIEISTGNFSTYIPQLQQQNLDLVFFDGNHNKKATLAYFEALLQSAHNETVFVFDDIYWSKDMTEAWEIIKRHKKVKVTIDTFFWGFVLFRKEQEKEHFKIRL